MQLQRQIEKLNYKKKEKKNFCNSPINLISSEKNVFTQIQSKASILLKTLYLKKKQEKNNWFLKIKILNCINF